MTQIKAGSPLRMLETHHFDVPVCKQYFPEGLTRKHRIVAQDDESNGRVTVKVYGTFHFPGDGLAAWHNPCFRLRADEVEVVEA